VPEATIAIADDGKRSLLELGGELDVTQATRLLAAARQAAASDLDVVVDCAQVERIHAAALQILASTATAVRAQGHLLHLRAPSEAVRSAVDLAGLRAALPIVVE
jgi:anti-anti-sigma factor